ncbi:MAG TPA: type II secretion system protein [Gemmatimonadales bacterium]|nr:type II secretion system protein [Gemmatimonadales bacterium]
MGRRGFTLIEVIVALVILSIVALSLGRFVGNFSHAVTTSTVRTVSVAVAQEHLDSVLAAATPTVYPNLVSTFNGTSATGFPGYPAMTRTTRVTRYLTASPPRDHTVVTVTVTEPTMGNPVSLTSAVAAP